MSGIIADNVGRASGLVKAAGGGKTIKRHYFINSTRTAGNSTADTNQLTMTSGFIPVDPVNNDLWVQWISPINSAGQSWSCIGVRMSKSGGSDYDIFGKGVQFVGGIATGKQTLQSTFFNIPTGTIPAGTYTINLRTEAINSQASYYNPNSTDDAKYVTQTQTELMITEWKN